MNAEFFQRVLSEALCKIDNLANTFAKKISVLFNSNIVTEDVTSFNFKGNAVVVTEPKENEVDIDINCCPDIITTLVNNGDGTYTYTNEAGVTTIFDVGQETITTLIDNQDGTFTYTNESGVTTTFDVGQETVTTIVDNNDGTFTYTNEEGTQVTVTTGKTYTVQNGLNEASPELFQLGGVFTEPTNIGALDQPRMEFDFSPTYNGMFFRASNPLDLTKYYSYITMEGQDLYSGLYLNVYANNNSYSSTQNSTYEESTYETLENRHIATINNGGIVSSWETLIKVNSNSDRSYQFISHGSGNIMTITIPNIDNVPIANPKDMFLPLSVNGNYADNTGNVTVGQSEDWTILGNTGTDDTINFLGTTDAEKLIIKTYNISRFYVNETYGELGNYGSLFINAGNAVNINGNSVAIGTATGRAMTNISAGGSQNVAIGHFAHAEGTDAGGNIAIGAEAFRYISTGYYNSGSGYKSGLGTSTGIANSFYGAFSGTRATTGQYNTAIGFESFGGDPNEAFATTGSFNTALGMQALKYARGAYNNIAIGAGSMQYVDDCYYNIGIGQWTMLDSTTGNYNVLVGHGAGMMITTGVRNVVIGGADSFLYINPGVVSSDSDNVYIGSSAGGERGGGNKNIVIGSYAASNVISGNRARGERNINIGYASGATNNNVTASIAIGARVSLPSESASGQLNIGNVIYGLGLYNNDTVLSSTPTVDGNIGIGIYPPTARLHLAAGTATAGSAPLKINTGTALAILEDGAIEYHSDHLWFTTSGVRYKIDRQNSELRPDAGGTGFNESPLKFTAGSLLLVPEDGAVEYDGSAMYYTIGSTRYTLGSKNGTFGFNVDGGGSVVTVGEKDLIMIPYACVITGWRIIGDTTGSAVVDVWSNASGIPTVADTITGSQKPTITLGNQYGSSDNVSTWTTAIPADSFIKFKVDSANTITKLTLLIKIQYV